jgi:hypothetical protein
LHVEEIELHFLLIKKCPIDFSGKNMNNYCSWSAMTMQRAQLYQLKEEVYHCFRVVLHVTLFIWTLKNTKKPQQNIVSDMRFEIVGQEKILSTSLQRKVPHW